MKFPNRCVQRSGLFPSIRLRGLFITDWRAWLLRLLYVDCHRSTAAQDVQVKRGTDASVLVVHPETAPYHSIVFVQGRRSSSSAVIFGATYPTAAATVSGKKGITFLRDDSYSCRRGKRNHVNLRRRNRREADFLRLSDAVLAA